MGFEALGFGPFGAAGFLRFALTREGLRLAIAQRNVGRADGP
jgi:hypothetical protein